MNVFIRTDASNLIGTGHVMRCLVLAEDLRKREVHVTFICRSLPGDLIAYIESQRFTVMPLRLDDVLEDEGSDLEWQTDVYQTINAISEEPPIDWLIVDHYAIDWKWERAIQPWVNNIMVMDDLANRFHDCDVLLDQNLHRNWQHRYQKWLSSDTTTLLGPAYFLLRQEFRDIPYIRKRTGIVKRILVSFGGSDPTNETIKALKAIQHIQQPNIVIDVVTGHSYQHHSAIQELCTPMTHINIHTQIDYLAELMVEADLAIGAGGTTTWERCYTGLPAITIETVANQSEILSYLSEIGVIYHLGSSYEVTEQDIVDSLKKLINDPNKLSDMSSIAKSIMRDYRPGLVADQLLEEHADD